MNVISINEKYKYKINISYPVTKYLDINKKIYNIINDIRNEFVKVSKRNIIMNVYFTLYIKYEEYSYDDITSYIFSVSSFTGGAHPNNYLRSIRFLKDKLITIDTLLSYDKNMLRKMCTYSRSQFLSRDDFKDKEIIQMMIEGTSEKTENYSNFAITNNGILVFFDYYQVAPYYYGVQKVLIPYNKLL